MWSECTFTSQPTNHRTDPGDQPSKSCFSMTFYWPWASQATCVFDEQLLFSSFPGVGWADQYNSHICVMVRGFLPIPIFMLISANRLRAPAPCFMHRHELGLSHVFLWMLKKRGNENICWMWNIYLKVTTLIHSNNWPEGKTDSDASWFFLQRLCLNAEKSLINILQSSCCYDHL